MPEQTILRNYFVHSYSIIQSIERALRYSKLVFCSRVMIPMTRALVFLPPLTRKLRFLAIFLDVSEAKRKLTADFLQIRPVNFYKTSQILGN